MRVVAILLGAELERARRSRWLVVFAVSVGLLLLLLAFGGRQATGLAGPASMEKTLLGVASLLALLLPLAGISAGAVNLARDREADFLGYLLSFPVTRGQVLAARFAALSWVLFLGTFWGLLVAMVVLRFAAHPRALPITLGLLGFLLLLCLVSTMLGLLIGTLVRNALAGLVAAMGAWLVLELAADLSVVGLTVGFQWSPWITLLVSLANPVQAFRVAVFSLIRGNLEVLGPAGYFAARYLGEWTIPFCAGILILWIVAFGGLAFFLEQKREAP